MSETTEHDAAAVKDALDDVAQAEAELTKARALIAQENARRVQQCSAEIQDILDKYGMKLEAVGVLQLGPAL